MKKLIRVVMAALFLAFSIVNARNYSRIFVKNETDRTFVVNSITKTTGKAYDEIPKWETITQPHIIPELKEIGKEKKVTIIPKQITIKSGSTVELSTIARTQRPKGSKKLGYDPIRVEGKGFISSLYERMETTLTDSKKPECTIDLNILSRKNLIGPADFKKLRKEDMRQFSTSPALLSFGLLPLSFAISGYIERNKTNLEVMGKSSCGIKVFAYKKFRAGQIYRDLYIIMPSPATYKKIVKRNRKKFKFAKTKICWGMIHGPTVRLPYQPLAGPPFLSTKFDHSWCEKVRIRGGFAPF